MGRFEPNEKYTRGYGEAVSGIENALRPEYVDLHSAWTGEDARPHTIRR